MLIGKKSMKENIKTTTMGNRVITTTTTTITNNVNNISSGSNIQGVSSNNLSSQNNTSTFSQGYDMTSQSGMAQNKRISNTQQSSSMGMFSGKLVDVLSNEIGKKEQEYHQEKNSSSNKVALQIY